MTPAQRLKNILGGSAGNFVEWFDWFAYSAFAIYFSRAFFPEGDQTSQLLGAAAIFAVGFVARPVGALLFGKYADRAGRRAALTASVALMCGGSLMVAVIPTGLGWISPALLLVARVLQGLSVGGEYGASATYISEMAQRHQRGFWSGFLYVTLTGGQLAALLLQVLLQSLLTEQQMYDWGWRLPFVIGAALAVVVWWIRRGIHETRSFASADVPAHERGRALTLFRRYPRETLLVMAFTAAGGVGFYTYTAYMQKLLVNSAGLPKPAVSQLMTALLAAFLFLPPLAGALADRIGHRRVLMASFARARAGQRAGAHVAVERDQPGGGVRRRPAAARAAVRLLRPQRDRQGRAVPRARACAGRRRALCDRAGSLRRQRRDRGAVPEEDRARVRLLLAGCGPDAGRPRRGLVAA